MVNIFHTLTLRKIEENWVLHGRWLASSYLEGATLINADLLLEETSGLSAESGSFITNK